MAFLKLYGERNTNTNYLTKIIELNLNVEQLEGTLPKRKTRLYKNKNWLKKEAVIDEYFDINFNKNLGWKHSKVLDRECLLSYDIVNDNEILFVTVTKNPYSWLLSLYRNPYHQYYKNKPRSFYEFLTTEWKTVSRENVNCSSLVSPVDLWNIKNRSYINKGGMRFINLITEDMFRSPKLIVDTIFSGMSSIEKKTFDFVNFNKSTKDKNKDGDFYRKYYLDEIWKKDLNKQSIEYINSRLDYGLMEYFGYDIL
ncbi:hypothetical protein D5085_02105 [Ectothiorhodospiraceae bacterium BW-2]|nr:hypothetical protein D5085_02105 [Ectothiorhodospiraceae bacterium BW-2]